MKLFKYHQVYKMMNIKKLLGFCILMVFVSCSNPTEICGYFHPTHIEIAVSYENQERNDLFNPEYEYSFNKDNLDIYYRQEGNYEEELSFSESLQIVKKENEENYLLLTLSSTPFEEREASILIDFPHSPSDTLDVQAKGREDELYATKMWYNGELIWSQSEDREEAGRYFEMVKTINPD